MNLICICLDNKKIREILINKIPNENYAKKELRRLYSSTSHITHPIQQRANRKIVELLIGFGADVNHSLNDGRTSFGVAFAIGNNMICAILKEKKTKIRKYLLKCIYNFYLNITFI